MINKKDVLLNMIKQGKLQKMTVIGRPTEELSTAFFNGQDLYKFFRSKGIQYNTQIYDSNSVAAYFPCVGHKVYTDICSIHVNRPIDLDTYNQVVQLFEEVYTVYQANLPPRIVNQVLDLYENEPLTFDSMLLLIPANQSKVAEVIDKSRQTVSDIKAGKSKLTLSSLSLLMKEYPFLPWEEFIRDITTD